MAQHVQEPQATISQTGKRRRISARVWRFLLLIATLLIIVLFVLASLGDFPTIMGMTPLVFATILSGCVGIFSLLVGIIPFIRDDVQLNGKNQSSKYPASPPQFADDINDNTTSVPEFHLYKPNVPTNPDTIQQRKQRVEEVYRQLTRTNISSVVLTGIGGQGKSTLAALVFNEVEERRKVDTRCMFQTKSLWFNVHADDTFEGLTERILKALDKTVSGFATLLPQEKASILFNVLDAQEKISLVVIDQFENLLDWETGKAKTDRPEVGEFIDMLNSQPCMSRILLTSRVIPQGIRTHSMSCLLNYEVDRLSTSEGVRLLLDQGVDKQQATQKELENAVEYCAGHGLALTLLANILHNNRSLSIQTLLKTQSHEKKLHYDPTWGIKIAEKLLDYIFTVQLNEVQRNLLLAFSIYREPVQLDAAIYIMTTQYQYKDEQVVLKVRDVLLAQHLLQASGNGCYQLHAIVAEYAQSHFVVDNRQANDAELRRAHEKAAWYYIQMGQTTCPKHDRRHQLQDVQPFVEAVRHYSDAGQGKEAFKLMEREALFKDLSGWGKNELLLHLCQLILQKGQHLEPLQKALIYKNIAFVYNVQGLMQETVKYYKKELLAVRETKERSEEDRILLNIGRMYMRLGDTEKHLNYYEYALAFFLEIEKIFVERQKLASRTAQNSISSLKNKVGERQFDQLMARVKPHTKQIVDDALSKH